MKNREEGDRLYAEAVKARENAYAPYSHYAVGACVMAEDGQIYRGCNVENASFGATICAERTAIFHGVSEGAVRFSAIGIAGGPAGEEPSPLCMPCGICRQVMAEFTPDPAAFTIYLLGEDDTVQAFSLDELLPGSFRLG